MSAIDNMRKRVNYHGGAKQIDRMNADKLRSLRRALLYSYQSCTIELSDGRQFRALINPDKEKLNYDDKVLSVPFRDICLNGERKGKMSEGIEEVGLQPGHNITWISNNPTDIPNTHWLIYLWNKEETAYFRGEIRQSETEVEINDTHYWAWFKGPEQEALEWGQKKNIEWNNLNYTRVMFITKDENTLSFFKRFAQLYEDEDGRLIWNPTKKPHTKRWEVEAVNQFYGEGMIKVALSEYWGDAVPVEPEKPEIDEDVIMNDELAGPATVYPYETVLYAITSPIEGATWSLENVDNFDIQIISQTETHLKLKFGEVKHRKIYVCYGELKKQVEVTTL